MENKEVVPSLVWGSGDIFRVFDPDSEDREIMKNILWKILKRKKVQGMILGNVLLM